jgi:catalase (peroxidase I)
VKEVILPSEYFLTAFLILHLNSEKAHEKNGWLCSAGLEHARLFLEPIKEQFPWITYADLWTLAGVVAIEEMGGPKINWKAGRTDFVDDSKVRLTLDYILPS